MLSKSFPGVYASLAEVADFVKNAVKDVGFNATDLFAIETAVDEAVSNIIEHAYEGEGNGDILCTIETKEDSVKIVLEDHGKPFDPSCIPIPDVTAALEDRSDHGLGVYLMCQLLDDVHFDFLDHINQLTLIKKKSIEEPTPSPTEPLPLWKHFLNLDEELLQQPNAVAICKKFKEIVEKEVHCTARLWLAEPFYPLPGEPDVETLPTAKTAEIVQRALKQKKIVEGHPPSSTGKAEFHEMALPVITQNFTLGVLHVFREGNLPFSEEERNHLDALVAFAAVSMQVNRQEVLKNWRYDQISLVRSVSSQIANVHDLDELAKRVTNLIQCSFEYYNVSLFTIEEGSQILKFRASSHKCTPSADNPLFNITIGQGLVGEVALSGKEIVAQNVNEDPRYRYVEEMPETRSEAVLPLLVENRILGVLDVQSSMVNAFHETDLLVVRSLADTIALAVEGAHLYHNVEEKADQISAVAEIHYALSSILDLDELLKEIVNVIHNRFAIPQVHIYTVHPGRKKVIFQSGSGKLAQKLKTNSFAIDLDSPQGMIPNVARTGQPMLANDVSLEPLYKPGKDKSSVIKSEMTIPLKFGNEVLGILDLQSHEAGIFDQNQLNLFEGLAAGIALSIRNASLFRSEKWRRKVAETFKDVAGMLSSNIALDALLDNILYQLEQTLPCDASAIWLLDDVDESDDKEKRLRLAVVRGVERDKVIESLEDSVAVRKFLDLAMEGKQPVTRAPNDPFGPLGAACCYQKNYSSIAVPLLSGDDVIGVLAMAHHAEGRYGSEATLISSTFASYAAVAIDNARLYANAQEDAWSSTVLLQAAEAIQSITEVNELLSTMIRLTPLLVGINHCAIYLKNPIDQSYRLESWYGFTPDDQRMAFRDDDTLAFLKMRVTGEPVFITNPSDELGITSISFDPLTGTIVLIPLLSHGKILGGFLVSHNSLGEFGIRNVFNDQTLAILQGIARQTSIALENIRLVENRQEEAYITTVLLQVAQAVVSQNRLDDILDTIIHLMPILVGVETCAILMRDEKTSRFITSNAIAPTHAETSDLLQQTYETGEFPLLDQLLQSEGILSCALESPDLPFTEWKTLRCQNSDETLASPNQHWLLGVPLAIKGVVYGVLLAKETNVLPEFHAKRIELIKGVAQQTALAIQNERLKQEMVGRERVEREFQLAREIQQTFLPEELPQHPDWAIDRRWKTAREVGGDFYDAFFTKDGRIALVIADVADKGMPAALYMTVTRTLIRAISQNLSSPSKVLERVNELLEAETRNGMFVTAFLGLLNLHTGEIEYANAGHNLPLLFRKEKCEVERLEKDGIALGVLENAKYHDKKATLNASDSLLLYTDGVTESFSASGELFTESRLVEALLHSYHESATDLLEAIENSVHEFAGGEPPSDDMTMIAIYRKPG